MKQKILLLCLAFCSFFSLFAEAAPSVSAPCAVLMDAETGLVLYEKNAHRKAYPASTTKIMTAILALENGDMEAQVPVSFNAVNSISYDSSKAGLFEGEVFSLRDMVYALLVCSANDAANVIAEHIAGDIPTFVERMNRRAKELGAENTHFVNTHGLHDENHYTTAYDLAVLSRHAMTLPLFPEMVQTRAYKLEPTEKCEEVRYLNSTNHLLNPQSPYYYADAVGIKTGYTDHAKSCLVSAAVSKDRMYIAAVLGAEPVEGQTMSFVDSRRILSFGAEACPPQTLAERGEAVRPVPVKRAKGSKVVGAHTETAAVVVLPEGVATEAVQRLEYIKTDLEAPLSAGDVVGRVDYVFEEKTIASTYLVADTDIERRSFLGTVFSAVFTSFWTYGILFIVLAIFTGMKAKKEHARRARRQRAETRRRNKYQ